MVEITAIHPIMGGFYWELPASLSEVLESYDLNEQNELRGKLEMHVKTYLILLSGTLKFGPKTKEHLDKINETMASLTEELMQDLMNQLN